VTGRAVPVRRSAENGGPAGSDTRTGPWLAASRRASGDPAEGSRSGLPSRVDRTGTGPAAAWPPGALATLTLAVAARASAVRASSGSEGPGSTSKSMCLIKLGKPYLSQRLDIRREPGHSDRSRARVAQRRRRESDRRPAPPGRHFLAGRAGWIINYRWRPPIQGSLKEDEHDRCGDHGGERLRVSRVAALARRPDLVLRLLHP